MPGPGRMRTTVSWVRSSPSCFNYAGPSGPVRHAYYRPDILRHRESKHNMVCFSPGVPRAGCTGWVGDFMLWSGVHCDGREDIVHQRSGRADPPRTAPELLREGGRGGRLVRRPALRLPGVRAHLSRRPALLRSRQPRPRARQPGVPRRLHPPGRRGGRGGRRGEKGYARGPLGLADVLRRAQPVHGLSDGVAGALVVGQDKMPPPRRTPDAHGLRYPLPALRPRGPRG